MDITHQPANPSTMATTNSWLRLDGPSTMGNCQVSWRVHNGYIPLNHVPPLCSFHTAGKQYHRETGMTKPEPASRQTANLITVAKIERSDAVCQQFLPPVSNWFFTFFFFRL